MDQEFVQFVKQCLVLEFFPQATSEVGKMGHNLEVYFDAVLKKYLPNYVDPSGEPKPKRRKDEARMYILNQ